MLKAFSFSIFGEYQKYSTNIVANIGAIKKYFCGYKIFIYYDSCIPKKILAKLKKEDVYLIKKPISYGYEGTLWRFEAIDFVDIVHVRDVDATITAREKK